MGQRPFWLHELGPTFDVGAHLLPPATVEALALWLGFSPEELALNRAGRLSDRQRQTVRFQGIRLVVVGAALILLNVLLAAAVAPTVPPSEKPALGVLVLLIAVLVFMVGRASAEVLLPHVHTVTGPLCTAGSARSPRLRAGNHLLVISYRRWQRWQKLDAPGRQMYRTYYVGRTLLSVEPWNGP